MEPICTLSTERPPKLLTGKTYRPVTLGMVTKAATELQLRAQQLPETCESELLCLTQCGLDISCPAFLGQLVDCNPFGIALEGSRKLKRVYIQVTCIQVQFMRHIDMRAVLSHHTTSCNFCMFILHA